jgi:hypothetical protein
MELNEAIYKVIKTQFKKDMGDALKVVEEAGYTVKKWDSRFYVKNPNTGRELCLREGWGKYKVCGNGSEKCAFRFEDVCRMDFVGYLEKPFNYAWYKVQDMQREWRSATWYKWDRLRSAKFNIMYEKDEIAKVKQDIANLQARLEQAIRSQVKYEQNLIAVRKELGLNK